MNPEPPRKRRSPVNWTAVIVVGSAALLLIFAIAANVDFARTHRYGLESGAADAAAAAAAKATAHASDAAGSSAAPSAAASAARTASAAVTAASEAPGAPQAFVPPSETKFPDGEYGKIIRLGEQVFMNTGKYAARYVGNDLSCANCHLDAGRKPDSAPLWAAFIHYPAFRSKTGKVDTLASRIQGCFEFSMNGKAPPQDDEIMTALQAYAFWLATGAPVGTAVPGSGYVKLKKPAQAPDFARGEKVYQENCALCHGANGEGQKAQEQQVFPPLWGPRSFNWGAGMHQLANASGFIQANMPLGKGGSLSEQQAWDVATFMNSHERPQDPRFEGSVEATRKKYHNTDDSLYGLTVNGHVLGSGR
ncbi:MAG: c-type cytochrome [Burkholderiaceae bacterium]